MTRLQKKCFVVSACFHGLLVVVLVVTAAFRSEPAITEAQLLTLVNLPVKDTPGVGGEPAPAPVAHQPAPPASRPAPAETRPQPRSTETPKVTALRPPKLSEPKPVVGRSPREPAPIRRGHEINVDLSRTTSVTRPSPKTEDAPARENAPAQAAKSQRLKEIASAFAEMDAKASSKDPISKVVPLPGEGGGEAFVNYRTAVFNAYYQAWKTPEDTTHKLAAADVKIVVARNGDIISCEFVSKSGDEPVDQSVQRAIDAVRHLPAFPPDAPDAQRSFIIRFNLEAKQSAG